MEPRSRMAALVLAAGLFALHPARTTLRGADEKIDHPPAASKPADAPRGTEADGTPRNNSSVQSVRLKLLIAGLGRDGCDVEVKPGNRSCRFKPQVQHVGASGELSLQFQDVEVRGAERNCTFAITVREPGQAAKTIYRGFRLPADAPKAGAPTATQTFICYMNSPSKLAELERPDRARR